MHRGRPGPGKMGNQPASAVAMVDEGRRDAAEEAETPEPSEALLARGSLFKRLGRDALHCLLPFLDLRSLGALDSAMTNRAEREEPWLAAVAQMDNKVLCEKLAMQLSYFPREKFAAEYAQWGSCFKWMSSKDIALPSELVFPRELQDTDTHLACVYSSSKAHKIRKIEIRDCEGLTAAGLKALERCSGLKSFKLFTRNAPDVVTKLAQTQWQCFKTLECIDLRSCFIDPDSMSAISSQCPGLKELTISLRRIDSSTAVADESMKRLCVEMPRLEVLDLSSDSSLSPSGLAHLKSLTNLRSLKMEYSQHTDTLLALLAKMPSLRKLSLLEGTMLSAAGFEHFKGGLAKLTELDIRYYHNITDDNLAALSGMTNLRRLEIYSLSVTDQGLAHLKGLTSLQDLTISSEHITDAGLAHLCRMPLLKLSISHAQITDAGLDSLHCFFELEVLNLWDLNFITDEGVERVMAACKKLEKVSW